MTVFTQPEPRRPFKGVGESLQKGLLEGFSQAQEQEKKQEEQDALSRVLASVQEGRDPLEALLSSGLSVEQQKPLLTAFAQQGETRRKQADEDLINRLIGQEVNQAFNSSPKPGQESEGKQLSPSSESILNESVAPGTDASGENKSSFNIKNAPDSILLTLSASGNERIRNLARFEQDRRKQEAQDFNANRDFASKTATPFINKIREEREPARRKFFAAQQMASAAESGEADFWSLNNLSRLPGFSGLRGAVGQQLQTAGKELFLSNLSLVKGRPTVFLEQQLLSALPALGQSKSAQLVASKLMLSEAELQQKKIDLADEEINRFVDQQGFVPQNIDQIVEQKLQPIAQDIHDNVTYDIQKIVEQELGVDKLRKKIKKKAPKGSIATPTILQLFQQRNNGNQEKALIEAKQKGWVIPTKEQHLRWEGRQNG